MAAAVNLSARHRRKEMVVVKEHFNVMFVLMNCKDVHLIPFMQTTYYSRTHLSTVATYIFGAVSVTVRNRL
jgi:hypothetical protein